METVDIKKEESSATKTLPPLEEVLAYKDDTIIYKFLESYDISFEAAEDLFNETKKWLWLCAKRKKEMAELPDSADKFNLFVDDSMLMLDEMWHTFVLFTKKYAAFCRKYFGMFLHHLPTSKEEKEEIAERLKTNREAVIAEAKEKTRKQYEYIYDALGEEMGAATLNKWYKTYAQFYTKPMIHYLRKRI
jgi:organic radical activating enzyme